MKPDKATMHMAMAEPELEPCDLFVDMGLLIIEGRTPLIATSKGYGEGPHCVSAVPTSIGSTQQRTAGHVCNLQNPQCAQQESFRKHMLLLWKNNIPMSIEVLLCPDCCHGVDKLGEAAAGPEPTFALLEQWTVQMIPRRSSELSTVPRALMQAVRSYLHFSQLSAWYSQSSGREPKNVVYRVCVPGEVFSNKFNKPPDEHVFPMSNVGWSNILKVSVKTMPRTECIPHVFCPLHNNLAAGFTKLQGPAGSNAISSRGTRSTATVCQADTKAVGLRKSLDRHDDDLCHQQQQQRHFSFSALMDGPVIRKEILAVQADCLLGDSLLDPPQCLEMYPKRYQSPSRSGSPVMETPEHWLFGGHGLRGRPPMRDMTIDGKGLAATPRERGRPWRRTKNSELLEQCGSDEAQKKKHVKSVDLPSREEVDCYVSEIFRDCDSPKRFLSHLKRRPFSRLAAKFQNVNYDDEGGDYAPPLPSSSSSSMSSPRDICEVIRRAKLVDGLMKNSGAPSTRLEPTTSPDSPAYHPHTHPHPPPPPSTHPSQKDTKSFVWVKGRLPISPLVHDALAQQVEPCKKILTTVSETELRMQATQQSRNLKNHLRSRLLGQDDGDDDADKHLSEIERWSKICDEALSQFASDDCFNDVLVDAITANHSQSTEKKGFSSEDDEFNGNVVVHLRKEVPSAVDKAKFRRSLDSAAYLVFHSRTGLPLTSSPAPVRKGNSFDFDSSLTSVSAIKHALFDKDVETVAEEEETEEKVRRHLSTSAPPSIANNNNLLGNFEESVLNGRLEPVSTVEGFTAEIGASGSFCPRHVVRPVTVFFYTLSDVDKVSTPYLGHINLGKKGYLVPKNGTIQVTLFNPHGTVVKMFVVMYDLRDMPVRCQTFLRQRTLYMPVDAFDDDPEARKWLRYLIHLRFASSKSGRIYLHTDIRMVIFRKSDMDVANIHGKVTYELRSFTKGPTMPRFSPRR